MIEFLEDYISGEKFTDVCDIMINPENWVENNDAKSFDKIINLNKDKIIVYGRPNFVNILFESQILRFYENRIILITHNSDYGIYNEIPGLYLQFSQNVNVESKNIFSLPIGLENAYNFPEIGKINKMKLKLNETKKDINLVYMNHTISTNPQVRGPLYKMYGNAEHFTVDWNKNNGIEFESYLDNIYNHKFVICPQGNGIDTHRTWECLYLGTIPIEKRNINNRFWEGKLPICYVNDWSELTRDFLENEYERIKGQEWNLDMLKFSYWKNLILEHAR